MIVSGNTKDGIFARRHLGVFTSPCGNYWSTVPYTKEQKKRYYEYRKETKIINQLINLGVDCNESVKQELNKIENNTSIIPKRLRAYLIKRFNHYKKQ